MRSGAYTREDIKRMKAVAKDGFIRLHMASLEATVEDNARLRALIKDAEFANRAQAVAEGWCPWCDWAEGKHGSTCPTFTADGAVR